MEEEEKLRNTLVILIKESLTDSQTKYSNGGMMKCRLCRGDDDADGSCSDAERATHCVYHVSADNNNFWSGRALTGEHILDCVRETNARFRRGLPMSATRVYVCELCFTHHAVIQSGQAPHETHEGRLVCAGCALL
jgi:hypothetical protein